MEDLSKIREQMTVVASDGRIVGKVSAVIGTAIRVTRVKDGRGFDHLIPSSWVSDIGRYVFLDKNSQYVSANCDGAAAQTPLRPAA